MKKWLVKAISQSMRFWESSRHSVRSRNAFSIPSEFVGCGFRVVLAVFVAVVPKGNTWH